MTMVADAVVRSLFAAPFEAVGPTESQPLYLLDSKAHVAASRLTRKRWEPRGWGRHQYMEDGEARHTAWCVFFESLVKDERDAAKVVALLNEAWK